RLPPPHPPPDHVALGVGDPRGRIPAHHGRVDRRVALAGHVPHRHPLQRDRHTRPVPQRPPVLDQQPGHPGPHRPAPEHPDPEPLHVPSCRSTHSRSILPDHPARGTHPGLWTARRTLLIRWATLPHRGPGPGPGGRRAAPEPGAVRGGEGTSYRPRMRVAGGTGFARWWGAAGVSTCGEGVYGPALPLPSTPAPSPRPARRPASSRV